MRSIIALVLLAISATASAQTAPRQPWDRGTTLEGLAGAATTPRTMATYGGAFGWELTEHRSPAIVAAALLMLISSAAAQENSSAILKTLKVRQLVTRGEPADHARLSAHYSALAEQYGAEARRHTVMSQSFVGNPSRNFGGGMSASCKRLADLNTQEATTLRELAAYHNDLAGGKPAMPPADAARFHSRAGAPAPMEKVLAEFAAKASTPAEHHSLEEYFVTLALVYAAAAKEHALFAVALRGTRIEHAAVIHSHMAALSTDAAKEAYEAAQMHKGPAGEDR